MLLMKTSGSTPHEALSVQSDQIDGFVPEGAKEHAAPRPAVVPGGVRLAGDEGIPSRRVGVRRAVNGDHGTPHAVRADVRATARFRTAAAESK